MKIKFFLLTFALIALLSCKTNQLMHSSTLGNEMFKVAILYLKFYEIDKGIAGRTPNDKVPYLAIGYFYIKNVAEYNKAIGPNIDAIIGDFKNYTNIQPTIQISEVKKLGFNNAK